MLNASYNYSVQNSYSAAYTPIRCPYRPQTYFLIFIYYRAKYYDAVADVLSDQHPDIMDIMVHCAACNSFRSADFRSFGGSKYFELDLGILVYYRYISLNHPRIENIIWKNTIIYAQPIKSDESI